MQKLSPFGQVKKTWPKNWLVGKRSDFLGRIFSLIQMSSIFACGFPLHRKIILAPYFCNVFPGCVLSKQRFCFPKQQNQGSTHLPPRLVQENLHYFSKMKNKTAEKITRQCFPITSCRSNVTCKN